ASGLDLSRKLKGLQPELEVILITGYASLDTAIEAVQIGAFDYLTKPIDDYAALALKVHNAMEKSRLRRGQRELLDRLSESEARYRHLVASAPDAVVVYDVQSGLVQDANGAAVQLYEYTLEELTRLRATQLGPTEPGRHEHRRKDGACFTADVSATEFTLKGRRLRVQSVRDATAAVQAERERRALEERLRGRVLGEGVRLQSERAQDLWGVRADPDQIGQVLINLAVNARDAMQGGGTLRIGTSNELVREPRMLRGGELPRGRYATLSVADSGEGM